MHGSVLLLLQHLGLLTTRLQKWLSVSFYFFLLSLRSFSCCFCVFLCAFSVVSSLNYHYLVIFIHLLKNNNNTFVFIISIIWMPSSSSWRAFIIIYDRVWKRKLPESPEDDVKCLFFFACCVRRRERASERERGTQLVHSQQHEEER